jgi:hypothetical protein
VGKEWWYSKTKDYLEWGSSKTLTLTVSQWEREKINPVTSAHDLTKRFPVVSVRMPEIYAAR